MRRRRGRDLNGLLLLDKPAGVTSNKALQNVKKLFNAAKAGHTGSLDPLATGLLVICFGKATKISQYLLNADKQYEVTLKLGVITDTGDADGAVVKEDDASLVSDDDIRQYAMTL
ncbi:MAG: tRNA pseudouridine(55) synthase TruB, partial [Gammaproteobacteria bacterium]